MHGAKDICTFVYEIIKEQQLNNRIMKTYKEISTRVDLSNVTGEVFYKYIYPVSAREFLFGVKYDEYAKFIGAKFILHPEQWEEVLMQWEFKEDMLRVE